MSSRPGAQGRKSPLSTDYADLRDPANGAKVPRCAVCGMPDRPDNGLVTGMWAHLRFHMDMTLCGKCIRQIGRFDARDTDPPSRSCLPA